MKIRICILSTWLFLITACGNDSSRSPVIAQPPIEIQPQSVIQNDFGNATLGNATFE